MEQTNSSQPNDMTMYYILGGLVLVGIVAAGYFLRPKPVAPPEAQPQAQPAAISANANITKLACEKQYYNTVIGFQKYYLTVEGVDVAPAKKVTCDYKITAGDKVAAVTTTTSSDLIDVPARGGSTFRCTTEAIELKKGVPTKVQVTVKDDQNVTTNCTADFLLP